jgi:hypothetical protein
MQKRRQNSRCGVESLSTVQWLGDIKRRCVKWAFIGKRRRLLLQNDTIGKLIVFYLFYSLSLPLVSFSIILLSTVSFTSNSKIQLSDPLTKADVLNVVHFEPLISHPYCTFHVLIRLIRFGEIWGARAKVFILHAYPVIVSLGWLYYYISRVASNTSRARAKKRL